jgi:hypothetical protein
VFCQWFSASRFVHLSPENREKSRSVVQTVAPCSSATAGEDGVHDERADSLSVVHKTAQNFPVPFARIENSDNRLGEPRGDAASASVVETGRSNIPGFVVILRKPHSVG